MADHFGVNYHAMSNALRKYKVYGKDPIRSRWTTTRLDELQECIDKGYSRNQTAEHFNMHPSNVSRVIYKFRGYLNLEGKSSKWLEPTKPRKYVARKNRIPRVLKGKELWTFLNLRGKSVNVKTALEIAKVLELPDRCPLLNIKPRV